VTLFERTNARNLSLEVVGFLADVIVADLSFISLLSVVPALVTVSAGDADFLVLVKPQFEAERGSAPGGVVRDPAVWGAVLERIATGFEQAGVAPLGVMSSPLLGPAGNVEFFLHARRGMAAGELDLDAAIAEGEDLVSS
jgi:23S rRNA (cytidine1920-2'-O)/16S rRNA (cytidine1409-2'-O)-methyltransferase